MPSHVCKSIDIYISPNQFETSNNVINQFDGRRIEYNIKNTKKFGRRHCAFVSVLSVKCTVYSTIDNKFILKHYYIVIKVTTIVNIQHIRKCYLDTGSYWYIFHLY